MVDNGKIKRTVGCSSHQLAVLLVHGLDYFDYCYRIITSHELLDSSIKNLEEVQKFQIAQDEICDSLDKLCDGMGSVTEKMENHEAKLMFSGLEKKEIYEIKQLLEDFDKIHKQYITEGDLLEKFLYQARQNLDEHNELTKELNMPYMIDITEKEKRIVEIEKKLKLDIVAGKITPVSLNNRGMMFDIFEYINWAVSSGYELLPEVEAYFTMPFSEFEKWCIQNNYSLPKRMIEKGARLVVQLENNKDSVINNEQVSTPSNKPRKKLIPKERDTSESLLLIYEITEHYKIQYLDELPPPKAWGKITSREFKSELIKEVDANKSIILTEGKKVTRANWLEQYRKRFIK